MKHNPDRAARVAPLVRLLAAWIVDEHRAGKDELAADGGHKAHFRGRQQRRQTAETRARVSSR